MPYTEQVKEKWSFAGTPVFPASNNGTQTTGTVDMTLFHRVAFLGSVGTLGTNANVTAKLQQSAFANGATATDITGAAVTVITAGNSKFTIEVRADQMTQRYVLGSITVNTAASVVAMFPVGVDARYKPATGNDVDPTNTQRIAV